MPAIALISFHREKVNVRCVVSFPDSITTIVNSRFSFFLAKLDDDIERANAEIFQKSGQNIEKNSTVGKVFFETIEKIAKEKCQPFFSM